MTLLVHKIPGPEWAKVADDAHMAVFGEHAPATQESMDFGLLTVEPVSDDILAYVTCRELDPETLYWGYGGSFPTAKNSMRSWMAYKAMTHKCLEHGYTRIFTLIENTNKVMLKFASKMGYVIIGVRVMGGHTMLEHLLEREHVAQ